MGGGARKLWKAGGFCILAAGVLCILSPHAAAFFFSFKKPSLEWKTVWEMDGIDEDLRNLLICYAKQNTRETVGSRSLLFYRVNIYEKVEPVFAMKDGVLYSAVKKTIDIRNGYMNSLFKTEGLSGTYAPLRPFEGRCVVGNSTHYRIIVAFYEDQYLKKTVVLSADTPKNYRYSDEFFRKEEHSCRILGYEHGSSKMENPDIPCDFFHYYWDRFNPLTTGFALGLKELMEREGLSKGAMVTVTLEFVNALLDYSDGKKDPVYYLDLEENTFKEIEYPWKPREVYHNEDVSWWNSLAGEAYCGTFASISTKILRYLGIDSYDIGLTMYGLRDAAHAMLGVSEKDIAGAKIKGIPFVVTVQKDDGTVFRIHVIETIGGGYYGNWSRTHYFSFIQYNPV